MVEWVDLKNKLHKTKVIKKVILASAAAEYIYNNRRTCTKVSTAYWI